MCALSSSHEHLHFTRLLLSTQISFSLHMKSELDIPQSKNYIFIYFPAAPCTSINVCVFLPFGSIRTDLHNVCFFVIAYLPTPWFHQDDRWPFWLLLDWQQLWEFLDQHRFTPVEHVGPNYLRYPGNQSPVSCWPTTSIMNKEKPMNPQCILCESRYMCTTTVQVHPVETVELASNPRDPICIRGLSLASPQAVAENLDKPHWRHQVGHT